MRGFDDLVRAGKVVYVGISDAPAWQVARMQTLADLRGYAPLVALQIEYSLAQRTVERELVPMARELGLGVIPWSPLASGVLTGKYTREDLTTKVSASAAGTRKNVAAGNGSLSDRNLRIGELVVEIARALDVPPAAVAVRWVLEQAGVTSPILGVRTLEQLEQNLAALEVELPPEHLERLNDASAIELGFPHDFLLSPLTRSVTRGDSHIEPR
jgi:aryl-alcohol dehydrogenase-like predicted oxidoreductase